MLGGDPVGCGTQPRSIAKGSPREGYHAHPIARRCSTDCTRHPRLLIACTAAFLATGATADSISPGAYAIDVRHTIVAEDTLHMAGRRLSLQLRLANHDVRPLFDLRVRLVSAGEKQWLTGCNPEPARLSLLAPGTEKTLTATFSCLRASPSRNATLRELQLEIEAVDESTKALVSFVVTSQEGN